MVHSGKSSTSLWCVIALAWRSRYWSRFILLTSTQPHEIFQVRGLLSIEGFKSLLLNQCNSISFFDENHREFTSKMTFS